MSLKKFYLIGVVGGLILAAVIIIIKERDQGVAPVLPFEENAYAAWITVAPSNGLFSARFPSVPQETSNTFPVQDSPDAVVQNLYMSRDKNGNVYFVSAAVYPVPFDLEKNEEVLRAALDGMVAALAGGELLSSEMFDFRGTPSLDFVIQDANKIIHQGKLIVKERTLYQLLVSYDENMLDESEYRYFLTSLKLGQ